MNLTNIRAKISSLPEPAKRWLKRAAFTLVGAVVAWVVMATTGKKVEIPIGDEVVLFAQPMAQQPQPTDGRIYYCGAFENLAEHFKASPWPERRISWTVDSTNYRGALTKEQVRMCFEVAWKSWAAHIEIEPYFVEQAEGALVRSYFGHIDGSGQILAQSQLADGTLTPKKQLYDRSESWVDAQEPPQSTIDMVRVAAHEIGHVIGLVHDTESKGEALMEPTYNRAIRFPTKADVARAVKLGYKARTVPGPAPVITVPINMVDVIKALREAGYDVRPIK